MSDQQDEVEVTTPAGKFRARGYDVLVILVVVICTINSAILYTHMEDAKATGQAIAATNREVATAMKESNKAQQESNKVQRLQACLSATKEEAKEREYMQPNSFCNRMAQ